MVDEVVKSEFPDGRARNAVAPKDAATKDLAPRSPTVWDLPEPAVRTSSVALSRERIVAAAVRLADQDGLSALSMRKVAAELDVTAMSLYRHVSAKEDLVELMLDTVLAEADLSGLPTGDWRADLAALARSRRDMAMRHPWSAVPLARPTLGPSTLRFFEVSLSALDGLALSASWKGWLVNALEAYVRGFVEDAIAEQEAQRRTGLSEEDWREAMAPYIRRVVESGKYPHVNEFIVSGEELSEQDTFETGLACFLDGLERFVTERGK